MPNYFSNFLDLEFLFIRNFCVSRYILLRNQSLQRLERTVGRNIGGVLVQKPLENVPCFSKMTLLFGCFLQFDGYMRRTKSKLGIIAAEWIAVLVLTPLNLRPIDLIKVLQRGPQKWAIETASSPIRFCALLSFVFRNGH